MSAVGWSASGAVAGLVCAAGVLLVVAALRRRRIRLVERVAPYLRVSESSSGLLSVLPGARTPLALVVRPLSERLVPLLERLGSSHADVARRQRRAGITESVEAFRSRQLVWGAAGLALGLSGALVIAAVRQPGILLPTLVVVLAALGGALACDADLTRRARRREARMQAEFPALADLLALAVGAGEGPLAAVERVATTVHGELAREFGLLLAEGRSGVPLARGLERLASRTELVSLSRFAETVSVAVDRGTPLADVLRAQAQDVREAGRRELMEQGGRKEVAMMVPVVFLVLPVTVVFAVFPSLATLRIGL
ncbi:type II secretion system F family protein [Cellulomonas sp. PhB143]|uniref:type II secretion system F family protein n=1 Tax=Cellulomonas sp. PhB143 TaxID=2485186 RepID=UPI000F4629C3|nr:type II secretion system F family protein [Cellulomonas sp. PhB143]ROS76986.1 tight adherence protein C [Cellulomonas sp. PhB143]